MRPLPAARSWRAGTRWLTRLLPGIALALSTGAQAAGCGLGDQWQEAESGFTASWRREGDAGRFVADYTAPDGHRATTRNQVSLSGATVTIRRLDSSDATMCTYSGTLSGNTISGTYACPSAWAGERPWQATVLCPAPAVAQMPAPAAHRAALTDLQTVLQNDRSIGTAGTNGSAIALLVLIRAALGEIPAANVAAAVDQQVAAFRSGGARNLRNDLSQAGTKYMNYIADRIRRQAGSAGHGPASASAVSAMIQLQLASENFDEALQQGIVPMGAITRADRILAQLPGSPNVLHFGAHVALTKRATDLLIDLPTPRRPTP